jgi:hypothetical protein
MLGAYEFLLKYPRVLKKTTKKKRLESRGSRIESDWLCQPRAQFADTVTEQAVGPVGAVQFADTVTEQAVGPVGAVQFADSVTEQAVGPVGAVQFADSVTEQAVGPVGGCAVCGHCHGAGSRPCGGLCSLRTLSRSWQ